MSSSTSKPEDTIVQLPPAPTRRTAQELVRDTVRRAILTGEIPGGTRLVQADLAQQLNVSTTPVREALRSLAAEGLVRLDSHRGAVVRSLTDDEVLEIFELRTVLEPVVLQRAIPRVTQQQLDDAAEIEAQMNAEPDPARWATLNRQFHGVFMTAASSERLRQMVESLQDSFSAYIVSAMLFDDSRRSLANQQHRTLLQAVRDQDVDAATAAMVAHMRLTLDGILATGAKEQV